MRYTLVVSYDGTAYHGWQEQKGCRTVAETLQRAYAEVFGHEIKMVGASRTDAGVHALGQVAQFETPLYVDPEPLHRALNGALSKDIHVRKIGLAAHRFHVHHDVDYKIYHYHLFTKRPLPFVARYGYYYSYPWDVQKMQDALNLFVGEHDFWSFCAGPLDEDCRGCIDAVQLTPLVRGQGYRVTIKGRRFLYHQVRRLVGSALFVAASPRRSCDLIAQALANPLPRQTFPTAPAHGLLLRKVVYDHQLFQDAERQQ
jgi:tRNA pseudouridine38-40 synthase